MNPAARKGGKFFNGGECRRLWNAVARWQPSKKVSQVGTEWTMSFLPLSKKKLVCGGEDVDDHLVACSTST